MIQVADNLWVGNSHDGQNAEVDAVLNVAVDLHIKRGWPGIVYAQVGLVDGPGNTLGSYHAAVLVLSALMNTGKRVLVHCHMGQSRSVAVVVMYLHLVGGRGWDNILTLLRERVEVEMPEPHEAHRKAFDKMNWQLLASCLGD